MPRRNLVVLGAALCIAAPAQAQFQDFDFRSDVGAEVRIFANEGSFSDQLETVQGSLILSGDGRWTSDDRDTRILFEPFARIDTNDSDRTYVDIREASLSHEFNRDWDILVGVSQIFWGVAESRNVVDIVNQFDTVEDIDEGQKLGQPLIRLTRRGDFGTLEALYLPYFRERQFPGGDGRLRIGLPIDADAARYERDNEERAGDFAVRYSNRFDRFDVGLHLFHGTSRNPRLDLNVQTGELEPFYPELNQGGVDIQWTKDAWLLKGEAVLGDMLDESFISAVAGFEYTFFDVSGSGFDVGLIGEYLYDNRDQTRLPVTLFENDIFAGTRVTLNDIQDTEILAGAILDHETGAVFASAEFQRRIGNTMLLELEGRLFSGSGDPLIEPIERDDHLLIRLTRFF